MTQREPRLAPKYEREMEERFKLEKEAIVCARHLVILMQMEIGSHE